MNKKNISFVLIFLLSLFLIFIISRVVITTRSRNIVNKINKLYNDNSVSIIYLGKEDCYYCQIFTPVMDKVTSDYDLKYIYFDIHKLTKNDLKKILKLLKIDEKDFGTPTISIIGNKNSYNLIGYHDHQSLFMFFQEKGIISKNEENPYLED